MQAKFVIAILLASSSTSQALVVTQKQGFLTKNGGEQPPAAALPPPPPAEPAGADYLKKSGYRGSHVGGSNNAAATALNNAISSSSGSSGGSSSISAAAAISSSSGSSSGSSSSSGSAAPAAGLPPPPPPAGAPTGAAAARAAEGDIWKTSCSDFVEGATASHTGAMTQARVDDLKKKFDCYSQKRQMIQRNFTNREIDFQTATEAWGTAMVDNANETAAVKVAEQALKDARDMLAAAHAQHDVLKAALATKATEIDRIFANVTTLESALTSAQGLLTGAAAAAHVTRNTKKTAYEAAYAEMKRLNEKWTQAGIDYNAAHVDFATAAQASLTAQEKEDAATATQAAADAAAAAKDKAAARKTAAAATNAAQAAQAAVASSLGSTSVRRDNFDTSAMTTLSSSIADKLAAIKSSSAAAASSLSTKYANTTRTVCAPRMEIDGADDLQREAMAVYYLSSDEPRPDAKAADGVTRLAYENAYGQKLRYSAAEKGWLVDNARQSGDGKAILWSASDTVCPSLAIDWQVFKYNDATGEAQWTTTATRRSNNQTHVVVLPLNKGAGKDFPACTNTVTVTAPGITNAGGTYKIIDKISGADHRGRPVYENENGNGMQLYYWGADEAWLLDPKPANDAKRTKGTGIASSSASVECPSQAMGWVVWNDSTKAWSALNTLTIV